jgi:hypothetical protein
MWGDAEDECPYPESPDALCEEEVEKRETGR